MCTIDKPIHSREEKLEAFGRLLDVMDEIRVKCPWDRKQTNESLRPQTLEEVYELAGAILASDDKEIMKELGDVLLHIVFYARIGEEKGLFDVSDVCNSLCDKLIYRHPHVFGEVKADDSEQVIKNWEMLKTKEKGGNKRVLSGVPAGLPSVLKAYRIQDKAHGVGFDWEKKEDVWDKVNEELGELKEELDRLEAARLAKTQAETSTDGSSVAIQAYETAKSAAELELGDFLFSVINAARLYKLNPDTGLERTCRKFISRFTYLEEHTIRTGRNLADVSLEEMDRLWNEAKALEK